MPDLPAILRPKHGCAEPAWRISEGSDGEGFLAASLARHHGFAVSWLAVSSFVLHGFAVSSWLRGVKLCSWFSFGPNAVRPRPTVKLKNEKQSLTPSRTGAHEAPIAPPTATGLESQAVAKLGGMAIMTLSFQRL